MKQDSETQAILVYLTEFRARFLKALSAFLLVFLGLYFFADRLYQFLARPMLDSLPDSSYLIATEIAAPFFIPLKFAGYLALFLTMPYVLYQTWGFISPALYRQERRWLWWVLIFSSSLFYAGILFAYAVVFPLMFKFFILIAPKGVAVMPDMGSYLDFSLRLFLAFGLAFQVPVLTLLSVKFNWLTVKQLEAKRRYVIVLAFILGMLLTPPDVLSQVLLALPIWGLFEVGLLVAKFILKPEKD